MRLIWMQQFLVITCMDNMFASVGLTKLDRTPKPALAVWDSFRK
jgi:hypothetical protein